MLFFCSEPGIGLWMIMRFLSLASPVSLPGESSPGGGMAGYVEPRRERKMPMGARRQAKSVTKHDNIYGSNTHDKWP